MRAIRQPLARTLDGLGIKGHVKAGLNSLLRAADLPLVGQPRIYHDLLRLTRTPRPRPSTLEGRLLFFTLRGWTTHVALETMLAEAVAQRGVEPWFFTCGGPLPLCGITTFRAPVATPCNDCASYVDRYFELLGFPRVQLADLLTVEDRNEIREYVASLADVELETATWDDLPVGTYARLSALWFLLRGTPPNDAGWFETLRGFSEATLLIARAADRLLDRVRPDRVVCLNGLFFAERVFLARVVRRGIPYTTYERGFHANSWVFRHDARACEYPIRDDFLAIADRPLNDTEQRRVDDYLGARVGGQRDVGKYYPEIEHERAAIFGELGLDAARPIVTVYTNITWDSAAQERETAFAGMLDWLEATARFFAGRDEAQLVIRVHPAEVRLPAVIETSEKVADALQDRIGALPNHVRIVPPESRLSSYTLGQMSRFVVVYTTTVGLELAAMGKPVVVAGQTHYAGLGFTHEPATDDEYRAVLERLLVEDPPAPDTELARRYAHFFFFRYMIPDPLVAETEGTPRLRVRAFEDLAPGQDPGIDLIVEGLIHGRPILLPREA